MAVEGGLLPFQIEHRVSGWLLGDMVVSCFDLKSLYRCLGASCGFFEDWQSSGFCRLNIAGLRVATAIHESNIPELTKQCLIL